MRLYKKIALSAGTGNDYAKTEIINTSGEGWIIAHRDNISLRVSSGLLETSEDNSQTFPNSFPYVTDKIINAYIFRNGNIMFSTTDNKIFLTNYKLQFVTEKTVYLADGVTPLPIHTPIDPNKPGRYYYTHRYPSSIEETDIFVVGNYCNVNNGPTPVHYIYTADFGQTFKTAYRFGQHPDFADANGDLLGDPNNPILTRHTHASEYCPFTEEWFLFTGDHSANDEIHWLKGKYDSEADVWTWENIFDYVIGEGSQLKITDAFFDYDTLYYCSDATGATPENPLNGIYRVNVNNIKDLTKHEKLISFPEYQNTASNLKLNKESGNILFTLVLNNAAPYNTTTLGVATNYGKGPVMYKDYPDANFIRVNSVNNKGFFRLDYDKFNTLQNRSFLIKVGNDLFNNIT